MESSLEVVKSYVRAVESGAVGDAMRPHFHPEVTLEEMPNRLNPNGAKKDLEGILEAGIRGSKVLTSQRYDFITEMESGSTVAIEFLWTGVLAVPVGKLAIGDVMRAHIAQFVEVREGKIYRIRTYDCFETF